MDKLTQNSAETPENRVQDNIFEHILTTANDAIAMFNKRQTMHFLLYCEEQLITLLPLAKMLTIIPSDQLADQIEHTIDALQKGEPISEITFRACCCDCLRAPTYKNKKDLLAAHQGNISCECGGDQLCACDGCLADVKRLESGERGTLGGNFTTPVNEWSAEQGKIK